MSLSYFNDDEWWGEWEEERREWVKEKRKETAWQAMLSKPTVDQINEMNWFSIGHKWYSIGESLGISKGVMEKIIRRADLLIGIYHNSLCDTLCIKAMLIKWLNQDQDTGNSERTWITIAKAVKNAGLGEVVFDLLEEVVEKCQNRYGILSVFRSKPTLEELKDTIVHHLGEEWHSVADSLGMSPKVKEEISSKFGSVPTQCSEAMFSKWLNHEEGTGHKERTWETVLTALKDAGRGDLAFSVVDKLTVKHKEEEALKKAPNIKEIEFLVIPHMARMWHAIGRFLGIIKAILTAIESEARKKVSLKQTCEMFQLWLDGREGTGDEERSWLVILRVLVDIGRSDVIFEIQEHFDLKTKDIDRALSLLCENTQSSSDDIFPVPTTSQGIADTASLVSPSLTNNVGQISLHDRTEDNGEVEEDKGCCSKSLSESSGSEVYTDPLPRLGSKRSCSEGSMGESSHATVEESTSTHHPPQSNGDHFTWSEPKRRHLEKVRLDKRGKLPTNQPARSRRRQKLKKQNYGFPSKLGLDMRRKCLVKLEKKRTRKCLSGKLGHSGRHPPDQPGFSGQKRSPTSRDLEESDLEFTASELSEKKKRLKLSKSMPNEKRSYRNVSVEFVVRKITREKLHGGIKKMLTEHRTELLHDDLKLINESCKDSMLGLLENKNYVKAANKLIDYFKKTHTGEELLIFSDFLKKEAEDDGRNPQLLNLAESIEDAIYTASPEDQ